MSTLVRRLALDLGSQIFVAAVVVPANPDLIDKLGVVLFRRFSPARVFSAFTSVALSFRSRAAIRLEILALRHQLSVIQRSVKRPKLTPADRLLWVWLVASGPIGDPHSSSFDRTPSSPGIVRAFGCFGRGRLAAGGLDGHRFRTTCAS